MSRSKAWSIVPACIPLALIFLTVAGSMVPVHSAVEYGLAAQYPHDTGLKDDPNVVFAEDFEAASVNEVSSHWTLGRWTELMSLVNDVPANSGGSKSLHAVGGTADYWKTLSTGYDTLYARNYVKYSTDCSVFHHGVSLIGTNPPAYGPSGGAGYAPSGNSSFGQGLEPVDWRWDFYTYWCHMHMCPDGKYWGNTFTSMLNPKPVVEKGQWICMEQMIIVNNPVSESNGQAAFWINGEKIIHLKQGEPLGDWIGCSFLTPRRVGSPFEGFLWRTVPELKVNVFWLQHYVDTDPNCGVWFDEVVLSKKYIGPMVDQVISINPLTPKPVRATPRRLVAFPAKGSVRFVAEQCGAGKFHLDIFNVTGKLVWNYQGTSWGKGPAQVMLPKDIGQGLYIAFLREGNETALEKFVVENR